MICAGILVAFVAMAQGAVEVRAPERISYETLVEGLVDLRWMCEEPRPGERSLLLDDLREGAAVLEHRGGPGVVGRVWCSRRDGVWSVWVDGSAEPVVRWRLDDFALRERSEALPMDPLAGPLGEGWFSVVPIAFAEDVRIAFEADGGGSVSLQADLRLLGEGVEVEAFGADTLERHARTLRRIARVILDDEDPQTRANNQTAAEAKKVPPERIPPSAPYYDGTYYFPLHESGILRWWSLRILYEEDEARLEEVLRAMTLRIETGTDLYSERGRVLLEMPLGDFFGAGAGLDPYRHYLMGLREDGTFVCRLPMPFTNHLKFVFSYPSRPAVKFMLKFGADPMPPEQVPPLRLRGGWSLADASDAAPFTLALDGPARLVAAAWASECGTDLAWSDAPAFAFADGLTRSREYAWSQVTRRDGPGRFGRYSMMRLFAHDAPVAAADATLSFAAPSVYSGAAGEARAAMRALWYGPADAEAGFGGLYEPAQRARLPQPSPPFFAVPGAVEGENLAPIGVSDGARLLVEDWSAAQPPASRKEVLRFAPAGADGQFGLDFQAPIAGEYELVARMGAGAGIGPVIALLDGRRLGDAFGPDGGERAIVEVVLTRGTFLPRPYALTLRSPDGRPFVLDCVYLRPVEP